MKNPASKSLASRVISFLLHQLLALAVFVGIPVLVTAIAPVSRVHLERHGERVSATAKTYLLFVVPYKTRQVETLTAVGDRFAEGTVRRERRSGANRDRYVKSEDEGFLVLESASDKVEVSVSPVDLESTVQRVQDFVDDKQSTTLDLFLVANWKFSILMGGLTSLLTVLYVVVLVGGLLLKLVHLLQAARGIPPERRLWARQLNNAEAGAAR